MATIKTSASINGFIASEPKLGYSDEGQARLYVRIGVNHFQRLDEGGFRKLEPTFHDLIQFGREAELSADRFVKGDDFVAQGYVRDYTRQVDGVERTDEQFVAKCLMHDPNPTSYTSYAVDRRPYAERRSAREPVTAEPASRTPTQAEPSAIAI